MTCGIFSRQEGEAAQFLERKRLLTHHGSGAISEIHDALGGIGELGDGVGEGLGFILISTTANGVVEASEAHRGEGLVLNQEESGDIASSTDRFVVNSLDIEGIGGKEIAALAVGDDVIEGDFTVEVRVGSEGVVIGVRDLGDEAVGGG